VGEHPPESPRGHLYQPVQGPTQPPGQEVKPKYLSSPAKSQQVPESHSIKEKIYFLGNKFCNYYTSTYVVALLHDRRTNARIRIDVRSQPAACSDPRERLLLEGSSKGIEDYSTASFPE